MKKLIMKNFSNSPLWLKKTHLLILLTTILFSCKEFLAEAGSINVHNNIGNSTKRDAKTNLIKDDSWRDIKVKVDFQDDKKINIPKDAGVGPDKDGWVTIYGKRQLVIPTTQKGSRSVNWNVNNKEYKSTAEDRPELISIKGDGSTYDIRKFKGSSFIATSEENLPAIQKKFTNNIVNKKDQAYCPICKAALKDHNNIIQLDCGHIFHENCIANWLLTYVENSYKNNKCPMCTKAEKAINIEALFLKLLEKEKFKKDENFNQNLLIYSVINGYKNIIKKLLQNGFNVNLKINIKKYQNKINNLHKDINDGLKDPEQETYYDTFDEINNIITLRGGHILEILVVLPLHLALLNSIIDKKEDRLEIINLLIENATPNYKTKNENLTLASFVKAIPNNADENFLISLLTKCNKHKSSKIIEGLINDIEFIAIDKSLINCLKKLIELYPEHLYPLVLTLSKNNKYNILEQLKDQIKKIPFDNEGNNLLHLEVIKYTTAEQLKEYLLKEKIYSSYGNKEMKSVQNVTDNTTNYAYELITFLVKNNLSDLNAKNKYYKRPIDYALKYIATKKYSYCPKDTVCYAKNSKLFDYLAEKMNLKNEEIITLKTANQQITK